MFLPSPNSVHLNIGNIRRDFQNKTLINIDGFNINRQEKDASENVVCCSRLLQIIA